MTNDDSGSLAALWQSTVASIGDQHELPADAVAAVADSSASEALHGFLSSYLKAYVEQLGPNSSTDLHGLWTFLFDELLASFGNILEGIAENDELRDLELAPLIWRSLFSSGGKSQIWTSNVSGHQVHGRDATPGGKSLDLQRAAIESGTSIIRVFVYDEEDLIEQNQLVSTIMHQLKAGIDVRRIGSIAYKAAADDVFERIFQTNDVMLIDGHTAIATGVQKDGSGRLARVRRIDDEAKLKRIRAVREEVDSRSESVTEQNVLQWP